MRRHSERGGVQLVPRARSPVMGPHWNAAQHSATASTRRENPLHTHPTPGVRIHDRDARCPQQDSNLLLVTSPVTAGPTFRHLARAGIWNCRVASLHHAPHAGGLAVGVVRGPSHSTGKGRGGCRFPSHTPAGGDSGLARPLTGVQPRTMTTRNFTIEFSNNKVSRHFGDRAHSLPHDRDGDLRLGGAARAPSPGHGQRGGSRAGRRRTSRHQRGPACESPRGHSRTPRRTPSSVHPPATAPGQTAARSRHTPCC